MNGENHLSMEAQEYILRLEKAKFDSKTKGVWYSQTPEVLA